MCSPGLVDRIEANQYRSVYFRVLQAEVQLTCHKWSLHSQKQVKLIQTHIRVEQVYKVDN